LISVHLQQAQAQQALGQREQALSLIADALHLAVPEGYRRAFLDEGLAVLELLPAVRHLAPQFVDELLSAAGVQGVVARPQPLVERLSERELEVLQLIAAGLSNREIGQRLFITVGTVKVHTASIYGKLGVHSRTQAVAKANALGLL
jgi:LuxR family maltose regulon positive regulatory protein